ncbi:hypothetical protein M422DRAFT_246336 [Sphaerobolus stellatus SS14]|nr:hypothetical protein M422DRAFT_246336 [Sphaerobolus stellatus SS14]
MHPSLTDRPAACPNINVVNQPYESSSVQGTSWSGHAGLRIVNTRSILCFVVTMEAGEISGHLMLSIIPHVIVYPSVFHSRFTARRTPSTNVRAWSTFLVEGTDLLPECIVVTISATGEPAFCHIDTIFIVFTMQAMRSVIRQLEQEKATYLKKEWTSRRTYLAQYGHLTRLPRARICHQEDISVGRRPSFVEDSTAHGRTSLTQDELPIRFQQAKIWCSKTWLLIVDEPQQHHRSAFSKRTCQPALLLAP